MAGNITVVGLGAGDMDQLTVGVHRFADSGEAFIYKNERPPFDSGIRARDGSGHPVF